MDWRVLALTVPLLFATYQSMAKLVPKGTSIFLVNAYASLVGFLIMLTLHLLTQSDKSVKLSPKTLLISLAIGALIGLGNFGIIKAYALGAPQSVFTVLFYVSLIIYGVIFGLLFWHEKAHPAQLIGAFLAVAGIFIAFFFKK